MYNFRHWNRSMWLIRKDKSFVFSTFTRLRGVYIFNEIYHPVQILGKKWTKEMFRII